jgi:hypothetical protein
MVLDYGHSLLNTHYNVVLVGAFPGIRTSCGDQPLKLLDKTS